MLGKMLYTVTHTCTSDNDLNDWMTLAKCLHRYAGLLALPPGLVGQVNKYNPHVMELELSR